MRYLILLLMLSWNGALWGQKVLSLENPNRYKRYIFSPGDYIRFQTADANSIFSGYIEAVDDSIIVLVKQIKVDDQANANKRIFRDYVPICEISAVYRAKPSFWGRLRQGYYKSSMIGGSVLIVGTSVNTLAGGGPPDPSFLILSTSILTSGLLVGLFGKDRLKLGKKWVLKPIEPMILPEEESPQ